MSQILMDQLGQTSTKIIENLQVTKVVSATGSDGTAASATFNSITATSQTVSGVFAMGSINALTYATTMTPNLANGAYVTIVATNTSAFTIANPTNQGTKPAEWVLSVKNSSGGSEGTITFGSTFVTSTITNAANGKRRIYAVLWDGTSNFFLSDSLDLNA